MSKEHQPLSRQIAESYYLARKFLRGVEREKIYSYRQETIDDFYNRLPPEKVWQLGFNAPKGRWCAEEVWEDGKAEELRNSAPPMETPTREKSR